MVSRPFLPLLIAAFGAQVFIFGCPPAPAPTELPDAGDAAPPPEEDADAASTCARACRQLAALGCPEGGARCTATCLHAQTTHLTDLRPACLAAATNINAARACGSVSCKVNP